MKTSNGYTLPELLIVLGIVAILSSFAIPGFASMVRKARSESYVFSLLNGFQLARNGAISFREPVVFCANQDNLRCGNDWSKGAIAFSDPNNNRQLDTSERLLAVVDAPAPGSTVTIKAALNKNYLRVMSNGMLENTAGSLVVCPPGARDQDARNLIFTRTGRMRFGEDGNRDGIRENAEGQPLSCPS